MTRQIVFDTETTGLNPNTGDRLVEIGCVEIVDLLPTGQTFHAYVNPERDVPPEVVRVHGLTAEFLRDKPVFFHPSVGQALVDFVGDAPLVAHNAAFDRGFINMELARAGFAIWPDDRWIDTVPIAQKRFPGQSNSLDALCKRFGISLDSRDKHGALIDAHLLAQVYLELNGGRERKLSFDAPSSITVEVEEIVVRLGTRPEPLPSRLTDAERAAHTAFVSELGAPSKWS
jgi:DNA polymerase-3 subunit epsilon